MDRHDRQYWVWQAEAEGREPEGVDRRAKLQVFILDSKRFYNPERHRRDAFREMLDSVVANGHTFDECKELVRNCMFIDVFLRYRGPGS